MLEPRNCSKDLELQSRARLWSELAVDLVKALELLEAESAGPDPGKSVRCVLAKVAPDLGSVLLKWYRLDGLAAVDAMAGVRVCLKHLHHHSEVAREDGEVPPSAAIDRAVCKLAADQLSWSKDEQTLELIQHQKYEIFLSWPGREPGPVDEYGYGLWDG